MSIFFLSNILVSKIRSNIKILISFVIIDINKRFRQRNMHTVFLAITCTLTQNVKVQCLLLPFDSYKPGLCTR